MAPIRGWGEDRGGREDRELLWHVPSFSCQFWWGCVFLRWIRAVAQLVQDPAPKNGQDQAAKKAHTNCRGQLPGRRGFCLSLVNHLLSIHLLRPDTRSLSEGLKDMSKS